MFAATVAVATLCGCRGCGKQVPPPPTPVPPTATVVKAAPTSAAAESEQRPIIVFCEGEPDSGPAPLRVEFTASDPFMNIEEPKYHWDFGDGSPPSDERKPVHVYERPGRYTAHLTVTDIHGMEDEDTTEVVVEEAGGPQTPAAAASQG